MGKIKDNPINTHQQCIKREKQHSNKYVKHLKVRNRDSWPWREDSTSQQDVKQRTKGSGRCNQQPVCNNMKMQDAKKGLTQQRCKTHLNQARKIFFFYLTGTVKIQAGHGDLQHLWEHVIYHHFWSFCVLSFMFYSTAILSNVVWLLRRKKKKKKIKNRPRGWGYEEGKSTAPEMPANRNCI